MKKLRAAIIGAGQESNASHVPNFQKNSDMADLVAICDLNEGNARAAAERFHIPAFYTSHLQMLQKERPDMVSICVTNKAHAQLTIDALRAGCHVLCEKPPAMNACEAQSMADAAREAGRFLTYNLHYRHAPEVKAVKGMIDSGGLGRVYAGKVTALRRRGIPGWGTFTNAGLQGGGPLMDIGVHMLDTAMYLLDYPEPSYVLAGKSDLIGKRGGVGLFGPWDGARFTVEDALFGSIVFSNAMVLQIETSFALNWKHKQRLNVELFGEYAGASVFDGEVFGEKEGLLTDSKFPFLQEEDRRLVSISDFIRCCAMDIQPMITPEQGVMLMRLVDALYLSAETKMPIEL